MYADSEGKPVLVGLTMPGSFDADFVLATLIDTPAGGGTYETAGSQSDTSQSQSHRNSSSSSAMATGSNKTH